MKKNLLIVIDSLGSGGAEKSLINLLGLLIMIGSKSICLCSAGVV